MNLCICNQDYVVALTHQEKSQNDVNKLLCFKPRFAALSPGLFPDRPTFSAAFLGSFRAGSGLGTDIVEIVIEPSAHPYVTIIVLQKTLYPVVSKKK